LAHQVLSETLSIASVHKHNTLRVNVGDVHGGTLHSGERETHLHVDVVHVLQEVGEVSASCSDHQIVTEVAKEAYETAAEELYEMVWCCTLSYDHCAGCCQVCHQTVGIDVVCAEHGEFAACLLHDLLPYLFPVLQLHKMVNTFQQHSIHDVQTNNSNVIFR
jgi:hypothetical protein